MFRILWKSKTSRFLFTGRRNIKSRLESTLRSSSSYRVLDVFILKISFKRKET